MTELKTSPFSILTTAVCFPEEWSTLSRVQWSQIDERYHRDPFWPKAVTCLSWCNEDTEVRCAVPPCGRKKSAHLSRPLPRVPWGLHVYEWEESWVTTPQSSSLNRNPASVLKEADTRFPVRLVHIQRTFRLKKTLGDPGPVSSIQSNRTMPRNIHLKFMSDVMSHPS